MAGRTKSQPKNSSSKKAATADDSQKRSYLSQVDVPAVSIDEALRIPAALSDYGFKPTTPLRVASAMGLQPTSSRFRMLAGASIAYGLTKGGYNSSQIEVEELGLRVVRPTREGDDQAAKREAFLKPRVVGDFLKRYSGSSLPTDEKIACNVLEDMGVPKDRAHEVLSLIVDGAQSVGVLRDIKGKKYVDFDACAVANTPQVSIEASEVIIGESTVLSPAMESSSIAVNHVEMRIPDRRVRRVFVTHGKNQEFIAPIKKLLGFGELEPIVSVERQSVAQPVPDKVMDDMRSCGAAIIHVDAEMKLLDQSANEHVVLNPNVLIEIGAAMALYGRRFILLVKEGVKLPSNLQGLFEVRYAGDSLDGNATIRLLEAINELKKYPLPNRADPLAT